MKNSPPDAVFDDDAARFIGVGRPFILLNAVLGIMRQLHTVGKLLG
jgi:hypothetical protein